ncbi:MAG: hypothetical protein C0402_05520 [Thermodesulfovibrio sp.]|nr:hypothetical protein [Thermodesulfovibrio sp.]
MWLVNEAEDVRVEWCNLGEGCSGDFDETDPSDVNLLRFDIHVRIHRNGEWEDPGDASYCTLMPANAPEELLEAGLRHIMKAVESSIHNLQSIKKTCEELSWISPEWFKDKAVLSEAVGNAYEVLVTRTSFAARHITVRARSVSDATMKALDQAGDYLYSEHDAEYEADAVREIVSEPEVA